MSNDEKVSRREFLEKTAIASAAAAALPGLVATPAEAAAGTIPHRTLGRTGMCGRESPAARAKPCRLHR